MAGSSAPAAADSKDDNQYIAQLLAKDAQDCSLRYSAFGMYAPAAKRPADRIPKPNTRFLRNILRETDTHNVNLKRKEEEEARERMRQLRRSRTSDVSDRHGRHSGERHSKRRRVESPVERGRDRDRDRDRRSHRSRDDDPEGRSGDAESRRKRERRDRDERRDEDRRSKRSHHHHRSREDDGERHSRRHHRRRNGSGHRDLEEEEEHASDRKRRRRKTRRSDSSRSPRRRRSHSRSRNRSDRQEDNVRGVSKPKPDLSPSPRPGEGSSKRPSSTSKNTDALAERERLDTCIIERSASEEDEDDELNALIGPAPPPDSDTPPVRCRGRGAYRASTSNIDSHFSTGYNPALDVHLSDDGEDDIKTKKTARPRPVAGLTDDIDDDWDMALEALRDRALWRQKGAERLREAGFEEKVVEKFVNNKAFPGVGDRNSGSGTPVDKDVAEVRWAKKGEGREWDRGKVVDEKGQVAIKTAWSE